MPRIVELISSQSGQIRPHATLGEAAAIMVKEKLSSIIVVDDQRILGIATEGDILHAMRQHRGLQQPLGAVMSTTVHSLPGHTEFREAYRAAARLGIRHIVVTDEAGQPLGVVSESDFRHHLGPDFFRHLNNVDTLMERMFPRLPPEATLEAALSAMEAARASCAVVVEGNLPIGILTERDVVRLFLEAGNNPPLTSVMTRPAITVNEDSSLADAAQLMDQRRIRHLVVVNGAGHAVGLLSEHTLMRPLELDLLDDALADRLALTRSRDQAEEKSNRDERYQRALLDNFPFLVWLKDTESRFLAVNRALAENCGAASSSELIGKSDFDLFPPELAERYRATDLRVMNSRQKHVVVEPIVRDQQFTWFETCKTPVIDDNGKLLGTVGFAQDISERRRAEEAILLRNAALAGMLRNEPLVGVLELIALAVEAEMPEWTCSTLLLTDDREHLYHFAAPRLPECFRESEPGLPIRADSGCSGSAAFLQRRVITEDIANHPNWLVKRDSAAQAGFAAAYAEPIFNPQHQVIGTFTAYHHTSRGPSDEQQALLTHAGQLAALILAHHQGAENLQKSLETFRGIFDSISEALFIQAADGTFLDANSGAEQMFGEPRSALIGQRHTAVGAPGLNDPQQIEQHIAAAIDGQPQYFEYWAQSSNGRIFPVDVRLHPCRYFGQQVLIASVVDISQRQRAALRLEIEHDLAQALATGLPRQDVLNTILQAALRFPDLDAGGIYYRQADGAYHLVAQQGLSSQFVAENSQLEAASRQAAVIQQGDLVCTCRELTQHCNDPELINTPRLQTEGLRCLTVLPVMVGGQPIACLYLAGRQAGQISPDTLQALETLTGNFAQTLLRLNAQEEAERLQQNLGGLFNTLTDFLFVINGAGRILHYNRALAENLGYGPNALLGQPVSILHPVSSSEQVGQLLAKIVAGQCTHSPLPLVHADGHLISAESRIVAGYWDGQPAFFGIAQDISERLIAEERQKLAASVFDNAHEGIMITDPAGHIIEVNATFSELTGYSREEAIGQTADLLKSGHHDDDFYTKMWQTIRDVGYWRGEVWNRKKGGEVFVELLTISTVRNRAGQISHFVGIFSDITVLKQHQERLEHLAHFDALTQLPNRMLLGDRMQLAMAQTERNGKALAVCYLDLDGFKPVNDQYGHATGDKLLVEVAQRLRNCVRAGDTVSRLGGDEFVLLFSELDNVRECDHAINRIIAALTTPFRIGGHEISISASIGVTLYPQDGSDSDTLLRHADQAMYAAKQAGRNRFHLFDPENDRRARVRHEEVRRIREALAEGEFVLYYQPKVDMRQGSVVGAEALIRWQHPERGLLLPNDFLPAIEGSELSIALGDWVIQEALRQLSIWQEQGLDLAVSVNIAGEHLQGHGFARRLGELLAAHPNVAPHNLELEVLETAALEDIGRVAELFAECRRFGVSFSLDDFGTGYSSLTYFRRLPADVLKIDQSFVCDMLDDPDDLAIVEGVIGLTQAFQRKVIAEGVETVEHGLVLLLLGCDMAQGFGIARPMPAAKLPAWVALFRPDKLWDQATVFRWSREDLPLLIAGVDHQRWKKSLYAYLADSTASLPAPPNEPGQCRFGRWYHSPAAQKYAVFSDFAELAPLHRRFHRLGEELMAQRTTASEASRQSQLGELEELSGALSRHLEKIQAALLLSYQVRKP
ncbi:MAG: putative signaling protein [Proteobacteria bacterium]|nr:putative signaling protein [Pseudomonadota bacterium]